MTSAGSGGAPVTVGGGAPPAVRVEISPDGLAALRLPMAVAHTAVDSTHANRPKGVVEDGQRSWQMGANDQAVTAVDDGQVMLSYHDGAAVRLRDVASSVDSVQDMRNCGVAKAKPASVLFTQKQPGANIIGTVAWLRAILPRLQTAIPLAMDVQGIGDRTPTLRASLREVERARAIPWTSAASRPMPGWPGRVPGWPASPLPTCSLRRRRTSASVAVSATRSTSTRGRPTMSTRCAFESHAVCQCGIPRSAAGPPGRCTQPAVLAGRFIDRGCIR